MKSDSQAALNLIANTQQNGFHSHATLLWLIRKLTSLSWVISFAHTLRGGNECADWLTKFGGTNVDSFKIWIAPPPPQLDNILFTDISGVYRQKMI
jgi:hypothetical protein